MGLKKTINIVIHTLPISDKFKAKWKIYRLVDRFMFSKQDTKKAENNPEYREKIMKKQQKKFPHKYTEIENCAMKLVGDNEGLVSDMVFFYFAYGYTPNEYLCYGFQEKTLTERCTFLSDRDSVKYAYKLNPWDDMDLFMDKAKTYQKFQKYYMRKLFVFSKNTDYQSWENFISQKQQIVKKNPMESCGRSIELLEVGETEELHYELYNKLRTELKNVKNLILEEVVIQHADMAKFNESSVNTVRCITLKTKSEKVIVPFCFMKVGRQGSFVDNGGAGGLLVGIDEKTGILNSDAIDETGKKYRCHPDTGVFFKGQSLPEWRKMISICKKMAEELKTIKWVGWDMAYTNKGWIVIEGNSATELIGPQSTSGKGIRRKMEQLMTETDTII